MELLFINIDGRPLWFLLLVGFYAFSGIFAYNTIIENYKNKEEELNYIYLYIHCLFHPIKLIPQLATFIIGQLEFGVYFMVTGYISMFKDLFRKKEKDI